MPTVETSMSDGEKVVHGSKHEKYSWLMANKTKECGNTLKVSMPVKEKAYVTAGYIWPASKLMAASKLTRNIPHKGKNNPVCWSTSPHENSVGN